MRCITTVFAFTLCSNTPMQDELDRKHALRATELSARAEQEEILALEFEARQRMWAIEQAQIRRAAIGRLHAEAEAKEAALQARQTAALAEMAAKDEAVQLRAQHEAARLSRLAAEAEEACARAEAITALERKQLDMEAHISNVRLQQTLRQLAEQEASATQVRICWDERMYMLG